MSPLLARARRHVDDRLADLARQLAALDGAQAGETKSSAGDKFETSRELLQQERDRLGAQLAVMREHRLRLEVAARTASGEAAGLGSTVTLATGERYLLATGLGRVGEGFVVSLESPLGRALAGARAGERVGFRGRALAVVRVEGGGAAA